MLMKNMRGFTLIELMIVMAVLGVLSAIAFPSFKVYTERTHRTSNCKGPLLEVAREMEGYKGIFREYPTVLSGNIAYDLNPHGGNYTISLANGASATAYTLVCVRTDKTVDSGCGDLSYDNFGRKGAEYGATTAATDEKVEDCWR